MYHTSLRIYKPKFSSRHLILNCSLAYTDEEIPITHNNSYHSMQVLPEFVKL